MLNSVFFLLFSISLLNAGHASDDNPLTHLDYGKAFNLRSVYRKHRPYLEHIGSTENTFAEDQNCLISPHSHFVDIEKDALKSMQAAFEKDCLGQLKSARRRTLALPFLPNFIFMGAVYVPPAVYIPILGGIDNLAAALSLSSTVFLVAPALNNIFTTAQNFLFTPNHPVDPLESAYAIKQHLIPRALWDVACGYFTRVRQNFAEDPYKKLSFLCDLTICQNPPLSPFEEDALMQNQNALSTKIVSFFQSYEPFANPFSLPVLQSTVKDFLHSFSRPQANTRSRPLYFQGPGGIGKTYFAECLGDWIKGLGLDNFKLRRLVITDPEALEGSQQTPGLFLNILRESCMGERDQGCILFLDEADWLSKKEFGSAVKRSFNGNYRHFLTRYFGDGMDGGGIRLPLPPMLIILAGNHDIPDEAIKSRFSVIQFPQPKQETFHKYACQKFAKLTNEQKNELLSNLKNVENFREIDEMTAAFAVNWGVQLQTKHR